MHISTDIPAREAIDRFVEAHHDRAQGHRAEWLDVLRDGLGHRPLPVTAWRDGQVVGWLPLTTTRSMLFGKRVVSLPYVNEAGLLATDAQVADAMIAHAVTLAKRIGTDRIELRHRDAAAVDGLTPLRSDKVGMTLGLEPGGDAMWQAIPSKVRNQVRKAEKLGVTCRVGGHNLLEPFFEVFARNMRDLGTPVLSKRLFAAMLHHLGSDCELVVAEHEGHTVAGGLIVHGGGVTEVPSASSLRAFNHTNANMALYWRMISRAIERGSNTFDFGRSTEGTGPHRFKKQWKAAPHALGWQVAGRADVSADAASHSRPASREDQRFAMAIRVWQKLPVFVTRSIGPSIARSLC